jgi:NADH-quinone oxidoreductase subunit J
MLNYTFYLLSFLTIYSALRVILAKNPVISVLFLILTFFCLTAHYILLNAQFVAIVNIIVYASAIMVLFLFVIMFLNLNTETEPIKFNSLRLAGFLSGGMLLIVLVAGLKILDKSMLINQNNLSIGLVSNLGKILFKEFLLPFEASSILFLSAMTGAVLLAKKEA